MQAIVYDPVGQSTKCKLYLRIPMLKYLVKIKTADKAGSNMDEYIEKDKFPRL